MATRGHEGSKGEIEALCLEGLSWRNTRLKGREGGSVEDLSSDPQIPSKTLGAGGSLGTSQNCKLRL